MTRVEAGHNSAATLEREVATLEILLSMLRVPASQHLTKAASCET